MHDSSRSLPGRNPRGRPFLPRRRPATAALALIIALAAGCGPAGEGGEAASPSPSAARGAPERLAYVPNDNCAECHRAQFDAWIGSHHDRAMQAADEETVLGDFNDARFSHAGASTRFFRRDGKFLVNTEGPDGVPADFEVKYTFGVEPLQQYLVAFPGGRMQALSVAWDTERKRWFHLSPDEKIPAGDPYHWTGRYQRWNAMCADCHSTDLRKGYDLETDGYETTWAEMDVSCQACHGPGSAHEQWARARREGEAPPPDGDGLRVMFPAGDPRTEIETCAPCHSRRHAVSAAYQPGDPYLDHYVPELIREGIYHADGQMDAEAYVYGSFVQTKMYRQGVRCTDCHNPHSLKLAAEGNALCARCHQPDPPARFPTLAAKNYDDPSHHHHAPGSEGARCVSCHMPGKNFMVVDFRRDHSFRVPRPDLSVTLGTPNACSSCHADRPAAWAAAAAERWYGPERARTPHYGTAIAGGRAGAEEALPALLALLADAEQPAIARATALELLPRYAPTAMEAAAAATRDAEPLVRAGAAAALEQLPAPRKVVLLAPLLVDPVRAVRVEAARVLASAPPDLFEPAERASLEEALAEFEAAQTAEADRPPAHLNLGVLREAQGEPDKAEQSYLTALRMDETFLPARVNLANLYNRMGRNEDAERQLREGIARAPEEGELHYSLGLLLAEENRMDESAGALAAAAALLPDRARVRYNQGLVLQALGRLDEAESVLLEAHRRDEADPSILQALILIYVDQERWAKALPFAEELAGLMPANAGAREQARTIRDRVSGR